VEILLVASCYRNRDKLRPDGPLGFRLNLAKLNPLKAMRDGHVGQPDPRYVLIDTSIRLQQNG